MQSKPCLGVLLNGFRLQRYERCQNIMMITVELKNELIWQ